MSWRMSMGIFQGGVVGRFYLGEGICLGWETSEGTSGEKCPDPHAGLQVSACSSYDLCYPG